MFSEQIKKLIDSEIIQNSDFVNIDKSDIECFAMGINKIELRIIDCAIDNIAKNFRDALREVKNENTDYELSKLLFLVNLSNQSAIAMKEFLFVEDLLGDYGDNIECIWGVSVDKRMSIETFRLIILYGFK